MLPSADSRRSLAARGAFLFLVLSMLGAFAAVAQPTDEQLEALRDDFRIIETRQGWALQPRQDTDDYGLIEITEGRVSIDGREIDEDELRRYVDESADLIIDIARAKDRPAEESSARPEPEREQRERRRHRDAQVSFGSSLTVEENEVVDEVVLLGGHLEVEGEVDGEATVVLGSAEVHGTIDGDLTVVGGPVRLRSGSHIEGDLIAVGGQVRRESGSRVDGEITQVAFGDIDVDGIDIDFGPPRFRFFDNPVVDLLGKLFELGFVLAAIFLVQFLAPNRVHRISERARQEPWKSGAVGLVIEVLFAPLLLLVTILLAISIVGLPLLIVVPPALALALVLYFVLGFAGVARWSGGQLTQRFDLQGVGPYLALMLGLLLIYGWSILGEVFAFTPWPIRFTAFVLLILGFVLKYVAWTVGLGAAVLDQFSPIGRTTIDRADRWSGEREISDALPVVDPSGED